MGSRIIPNMKVAFISGPYRAGSINEIVENIRSAEYVAKKYWALGYAVVCPHMNTALFDGYLSDKVWLQGHIKILTRCDVIIMMKNWHKSVGAQEELKTAKQLNKEIIYDGEGW